MSHPGPSPSGGRSGPSSIPKGLSYAEASHAPFGLLAPRYTAIGWPVIPILAGDKKPAVSGHHGEPISHPDPTSDEIDLWVQQFRSYNIALRMPEAVIALDVDVSEEKDGTATIAAAQGLWGELPPTWRIVNRGDGSGHLLFRVAAGFDVRDMPGNLDAVGPGVDVISRHLRYSVAPGSIHVSGRLTTVLGPDGKPRSASFPRPGVLPELPAGWLAGLSAAKRPRPRRKSTSGSSTPQTSTQAWLSSHDMGEPSEARKACITGASERLASGDGRHDTVRDAVYRLVHLAHEGHQGLAPALGQLEVAFRAALGYERRDGAGAEWQGMVDGAVRKASESFNGFDPVEFTDSRLSERLDRELSDAGKPLIWVDGLGWLRWTARRWERCSETRAKGILKKHLLQWHERETADGATEYRLGEIKKLLADTRQNRLLSSLKAEVAHSADELDAHPDLLNVRNGVVDLPSGQLLAHSPGLMLTHITRVDYDPAAAHPDWDKAISALPPAVGTYLLDRLGQAITGHAPTDDKVIFLDGPGSSGKSTLMSPIKTALGSYAGMVPQPLLMPRPGSHPTDLMTLRGLRLAWIEELPETGRIDTQRLKTIAGTETIVARHLYADNVQFAPTHALIVTTNHLPDIPEVDHGTWRRLERIPFEKRFRAADGTIDSTLRQRSRDNEDVMRAALATLVRHSRQWYESGQVMPIAPKSVREAVANWRRSSDMLLAYITARTTPDLASFVSASELFSDFQSWHRAHASVGPAWDRKLFMTRLADHEGLPAPVVRGRRRISQGGYSTLGSTMASGGNAVSCWSGIRFTDDSDNGSSDVSNVASDF